jgi:hypothetical protein
LILDGATGFATSMELELSQEMLQCAVEKSEPPVLNVVAAGSAEGFRKARAMEMRKRSGDFDDVLVELWECVVQPVVAKMGLKVS